MFVPVDVASNHTHIWRCVGFESVDTGFDTILLHNLGNNPRMRHRRAFRAGSPIKPLRLDGLRTRSCMPGRPCRSGAR